MAFTLQAIVGSATVNLTNGAPFKLLSAMGMGGAPVRRVTARGPAQQGDTDLGYRLQAREIELQIGFAATTDAILDGYRDTLASIFKPTASTPVQLRVTRDDAEVRQLDCYTVGVLRIDLVPEHRPGHYHVATVRLRASNPAWYSVTPGTAIADQLSEPPGWQYAGGIFGDDDILMHGSAPAQGEAWSYTGSIGTSDPFTLVMRVPNIPLAGNFGKYLFFVQASVSGRGLYVNIGSASQGLHVAVSDWKVLDDLLPGTATYFIRYSGGTQQFGDVTFHYYDDSLHSVNSVAQTFIPLSGTPRYWRRAGGVFDPGTSAYWPGEIDRYALYDRALNSAEMTTLHTFMAGTILGTVIQTISVPYAGDVPEYPIINITGPISDPTITNLSTGDTLDFGTITIGSGTTYVIDTRYGYKSVTAGTVQKRSELTDDSDLGTWHLAPAPVATGGTNVIFFSGSATGSATQFEIVYYNRYLSF